jgi:thiamine biosynthesis lipoprotein
MSLSTSGSCEKFFLAEGRIYSHIIDPRTGYPAQGTSLVSVLGRRAVDTEAWTKPYLIHGREWAARHKPAEFSVFMCGEDKDLAGEWLE